MEIAQNLRRLRNANSPEVIPVLHASVMCRLDALNSRNGLGELPPQLTGDGAG